MKQKRHSETNPLTQPLRDVTEGNLLTLCACTIDDCAELALLNKQLIEDEGSDNPMTIAELEMRARKFLQTDATAYLFKLNAVTIGYALIRTVEEPMYLRQFLICRAFRRKGYGRTAFQLLIKKLGAERLDIDVLTDNKPAMEFWKNVGFGVRHSVTSMRYVQAAESR